MEIWRAAGECPQNWTLHAPDILPSSSDESTTGIGGLNCFEWCALVAKSDHGQVAHIERARQIADADIQRSRKRVISDIRSIVTCAACTADDGYAELVVQSGDPRDVNRLVIEQGLTARDAPARAADG